MTELVGQPRSAKATPGARRAEFGERVERWSKALVLLLGSLVTLGLDILRLPDHTAIFTTITPFKYLTVEMGWVNGLAYLWQQGSLSGRDFHFPYGPLSQLIAWLGAQLSLTRSAFDAFPLVLLAYMGCGLLVFVLMLVLLPQLRAWHSLVLFVALLGLQAVIVDPLGVRYLIGPLVVVMLTHAVASPSDRRGRLWAALAGLIGFLGQLFTAELALHVIFVATVSLGVYSVLALRPGLVGRADLRPPRHYLLLLAAVLGVFILGNLVVSGVYKLTASTPMGLFDYQRYALETIRGYNYTMGLTWELDRFQTRGLAVIILAVVGYIALNFRRLTASDGYLLVGLLVMAVVQFKSGTIRSDIGHIVQGMTTFLLLFLILVRDWARLGRWHGVWLAGWAVLFVLLLRVWPWTDPALFSKLGALLSGPVSPVARFQYYASLSTPPTRFIPAGLVDADDPAPLLTYPYENYFALAMGRPLAGPVPQVISAHTEALQRRYAELLDLEPATLEITYGLDNIASLPVGEVQYVSRVPVIFERLYRTFELETARSYGGFYHLKRRAQPAELQATPVALAPRPAQPGHLALASAAPSQCSLLRLHLTLTYPPTSLLGRPNPVAVTVGAGDGVVKQTRLVAIEANREFSTYISLMDDYRFAEVFGPTGAQAKAWESLDLAPVPTGLFQVSPTQIAVRQVDCITIPPIPGAPPLSADGPPIPDSVPPLYQGHLETVNCQAGVVGWLWDVNRPASALQVEVYADDRPQAMVTANEPRPDLVTAGKGTGRYQFQWPLPPALRDNQPHRFQVRVSGTPLNLNPDPVPLTCPGP